MKKLISILAVALAAALVLCLFGCGEKTTDETTKPAEAGTTAEAAPVDTDADLSELKVGLICLHDKNSTYDLNFIKAMEETQEALGLTDEQVIIKTNVPEGSECYETAVELVEAGCDIIFADSFGHEDYMLQAAGEYPDVQFCHATGTKAHTENVANYHNAFASIYEGRFLAGVAAGLKLNAMIEAGDITAEEAKIGYVGAYPYAEVKSGYTSFYLGAKYVCPTATMKVIYTNSWYDEAKEKEAANTLINTDKCVLVSQHADSLGAPSACEAAGVPNVSYNGSTKAAGPNTYIISSRINWAPYYEYAIKAVAAGTAIDTDYVGTIATGSVELAELNEDVAAEGTAAKIEEVKAALEAGTLHVFDTATFTVDGEALTSYQADVDSDAAYTPDTEVISDGYFHESEYRSAPYFDLVIDGIEAPVEG